MRSKLRGAVWWLLSCGTQLVLLTNALAFVCSYKTHVHVVHTASSWLTSSSTQAPLHELKSTQMSPDGARNPFITLIMERMQEWPSSQPPPPPPPLYKPLKPTLTANERPAQSVSNPAPIWSRLPGASSAFVPWLQCEGRGLHAAPRSPSAAPGLY